MTPPADKGTPIMCTCCGQKKVGMDYPDRMVMKVNGHFWVIYKPLTQRAA